MPPSNQHSNRQLLLHGPRRMVSRTLLVIATIVIAALILVQFYGNAGMMMMPHASVKAAAINKRQGAAADTSTMKEREESSLPQWMQDYFIWHQEQLQLLNATNYRDGFKFLVLSCVAEERKCGGTADRLKPIPTFILEAYRQQRIFFIHWDRRPCKLEEFLVPNLCNWSMPDYMMPLTRQKWQTGSFSSLNLLTSNAADQNATMLRGHLQVADGCEHTFRNQTQISYIDIYPQLFHHLFRPSPPVHNLVQTQLQQLGLSPGNYSVAHLRNNYACGAFDGAPDKSCGGDVRIKSNAIAAVNCASTLRPTGTPIYFTSDSTRAVQIMRDHVAYHVERGDDSYSAIVPAPTSNTTTPLHKDKNPNITDPAAYYPVFVDLLIMSMGRCVAYGKGGYAVFALLIGLDPTCSIRYGKFGSSCQWQSSSS